MTNEKKIILTELKTKELEQLMEEMKASKFRAKQIQNWIYLKSVSEIDEMTDLSIKFRDELKKIAIVTETKITIRSVRSA